MGDIKPIMKTELEYVDILATRTNEILKPLGIDSKTAMESFRHFRIWGLVYDELREQLGFPGRPLFDQIKDFAEGEDDGSEIDQRS